MSRIHSAIAISDLHLGRDFSYLNSRVAQYAQNRKALCDLLKTLGEKDEVIICGDLLEYSFSSFDVVFKELREFFSILKDAGPYKRIVYIPGNHDHHFWRTLAEQIHIYGKLLKGIDPPNYEKYPNCFVDERFSSENQEIILDHLWPGEGKPEIVVKYPHHLARVMLGNDEEAVYLFTHGHYLEDAFKVINFLIKPADLKDLESLNNMWLELICYHIGHAGRLSEIVRNLEKKIGERDEKIVEDVKKLKENIYISIKRKLNLKWYEAIGVKWGLYRIAKKIKFNKNCGLYKAPLDEKLKISITEYINSFIIQRYQKGKAAEYFFPCDCDIPTPFTFVFGHTHRPTKGEPAKISIDGKQYPLLNTGGWLRSDSPKQNGETAGVIVIDQSGSRWASLEGKIT